MLHGRRPIVVEIEYDEPRLRIAVTDASPVSPTFSLLDPTAVTGRVDIELAITRHHAELVRDYRDALVRADRLCTAGRLLHEAPGAAALATRQDYLRRILAQLSS